LHSTNPKQVNNLDTEQVRRIRVLHTYSSKKSKGIPRQAEVAVGVPGRLRPWIFLTSGTTRVVGCQPNAPAAFTPGEIPGTHFQRLSQPQGTWFCLKEPWKKSQVTPPGIDPRTVRHTVVGHTKQLMASLVYNSQFILKGSSTE